MYATCGVEASVLQSGDALAGISAAADIAEMSKVFLETIE